MVGSQAKRQLASYFHEVHARSIARACALAGLSRASWYYRSRQGERDAVVAEALTSLAEEFPTRGFDNYFARLRTSGHRWARSRVLRVYRQLGLTRRVRPKRRVTPTEDRRPMQQLSACDEVWACDFLSDALTDGRSARVIAVMDEYSRECLTVEASVSYPATRVCRVLDCIVEERAGRYPACLRTDNGPEFVANAIQKWCEEHGVHHHRIEPGRPMDNGRIERLNRTIRADVLDFWAFDSLRSLNDELDRWRTQYNELHPHTSLNGLSPRTFASKRSVEVASSPSGSLATSTL